MAAATQTATTGANVNKVWRKIQGKIAVGMQFQVEEFEQIDELTESESTPWSAREVTKPVDIVEGAGASSIVEGGYLARPSTPNMQEITISILQLDGRFNATGLSMYGDKTDAQIERQLVFQGTDKLRTMARTFGDYFYGTSNGYLCQLNAALTGTTLTHTLMNGYGQSSITDVTWLADKFRSGDYVALIRSAALVTNAIGLVGNVDSTNGAITVTWNGTVSANSADYVVKANSMENSTIAGTDYGAGFVGMTDILTASSVHSLTNATLRWAASYSDTSSTRFTGSKLHRANDAIQDYGSSAGANFVYMSKGVHRDVINLMTPSVKFDSPMGMEIDGSIKSKGKGFFMSRRVPPGWVIPCDKSGLALWSLLPKPTGKYSWSDGKELIDQDIMVFDMRWPVALVCNSRAKFTYFFNQTTA